MSSRSRLRLFGGGIVTETNVFSPLPTGLQDYTVAQADDPPEIRHRIVCGSSFARYRDRAAAEDCTYVQGLYAFAMPAGVTTKAAYEALRDTLLDELQRALPLDGVLLTLHGAMVAYGYEDCETDLVVRARELVGPNSTIGVLLDPHCDLPDEFVSTADVVVAYKEYPHIDIDQRADELAELVIASAQGRITPTIATFDCRMLGLYPTPPEPMRSFVERMRVAERQEGILSVSLGHGFPWGDSPAMGTRVLVVSDRDRARAATLAADLGHRLFAIRHDIILKPSPFSAALDHALGLADSGRPTVIADISDNPGGGAPGDSTFILRALLERGVSNAAVALLWDPLVVHQAFAAGEGGPLEVRLGGKMGRSSGQPLDLAVQVRGLVDNLVQHWPQAAGTLEVSCGSCAWLTCGGLDVIVGNLRQQVLGPEVFTAFDIEPTDRRLLVVKSTNHFRAAFAPIAAEIIYMDAPGALNADPRETPFQRLDTDKFPWVEDPWGS